MNPRTGIDHAVAAEQWATRVGDMRLHAFCAAGAARAYSADGQREMCITSLGVAETALGKIRDQDRDYTNVIYYDEALHASYSSECHLELGEAQRAAYYAQNSLATLDPSLTRIAALTYVDLGRAYVLSTEVEHAARLFGDAGETASQNSSARLVKAVREARSELHPWENTSAVHDLDDRLAAYGLT